MTGTDRSALDALLRDLGVTPILHAGGTKSSMGGTTVPGAVAAVMREALDFFVPVEELLAAVGDAVAVLLGGDSAAVVAGAASGCVLGAAAIRSLAGDDPTGAVRNQLVTQRRHVGRYTYLYEQGGCELVEVGTMNDCPVEEYRRAIGPRTAGLVWLEGPGIRTAGATLEQVGELGAEHGLPVLVDAAAMAFPVGTTRSYLDAGADLVVVSGGKLLHGPQNSGFAVGRRDLVVRMRELGFPHQGVGRAQKVTKEVALGAYVAVRDAVARDTAADLDRARSRADHTAAVLRAQGVGAVVECNHRHLLPAVVVRGVRAHHGRTPSAVTATLLAGTPRIFLAGNDPRDELYVEFASLDPAHDDVVAARLLEALVPQVPTTHPATP